MKILVTGGAGFIGSHIVDAYVDSGHEVVVVDDLSVGRRENLNAAAAFHECDICSSDLKQIFEKELPEIVCHTAAQIDVTRSVDEPAFDVRVNVLGLVNLLELSIRHGLRRFIFSSTGGAIYGDAKDYPATEETEPAPLSPYAASKLSGEAYIRMYSRSHGLEHVILRYSNVFGPRQAVHGECGVCAVLTEKMLAGEQPTLFGFGEPVRDYVYVGDVAQANVLALETGTNDTFNISSAKPTTVLEIFDALKTILQFDQEPVLKPLRPGEVEKSLCANAKAAEGLGWSPSIGLDEGLRHTVAHFQG